MKDALDQNSTRIKAGPDAPKTATCPACDGTVDLRGRRVGKNPHDRAGYYPKNLHQ